MSAAAASMTQSISTSKDGKAKLDWTVEYDLKFFLKDLGQKKLTPSQIIVKNVIEKIIKEVNSLDPKTIQELERV